MDEVLQALIDAQEVRPTIIVGIHNNGSKRRFEYMPQKPLMSLPSQRRQEIATALMPEKLAKPYPWQADNYLKFIVKELKPFIDKNYSVYHDPANTFIGGSSFGGMISWYALCQYPKVFGGAICLSTHWPASFPDRPFTDLAQACIQYFGKKFPFQQRKIYFDFGTATLDAYYEPYQRQVDAFFEKRSLDIEHWRSLKFVGADHSERAWHQRLDIPLRWLLAK
jgi:enterochelin esterase-like enzyme